MVRLAVLIAIVVGGALLLLSVSDAPLRESAASGPAASATANEESSSKTAADAEFKKAGVCARCHVVSVLEWSLSGHLETEADCQECHGASRDHVANERNEVKPDRLPHGDAISKQLCSTCHETGCPDTLRVDTCQKCHHVHALIDPAKPPTAKNERLEKMLVRWKQFYRHMNEGDQHVKKQDWKAAQAAFRGAMELIPGNQPARMRLQMCMRQLQPNLPGFKRIGDKLDARTGLPRAVEVADWNIPMLLVLPGEFDIGSDAFADARPIHTARIDAVYLGRYEVTQGQWKAVMNTNPSAHQGTDFPNAERLPVERVSFSDCQEFLRRLNRKVPGGGFRLPTEVEWEYACRSGRRLGDVPQSRETQSTVEQRISKYAWFRGNSVRGGKSGERFLDLQAYAPRPVGTRTANDWGFYDMRGNVSEWCSSLYRPYLYNATDGRESLTAKGMRVVRGGNFADSAASLDPALRHAVRPHRRLRFHGLRLARDVPKLPQIDTAEKAK